MKRAIAILLGMLAVCFSGFGETLRGEETNSLEFFKNAFAKRSEELVTAEALQNQKMINSYKTRVIESLGRYKNAGDLDAVQEINDELKRIEEGKVNLESITENPVSQIEALQAILKTGFEPTRRRRLQDEQVLLEGYLRALENLKSNLVKENKIQEAIDVKAEIEDATKLLKKVQEKLNQESPSQGLPSSLEDGLILRYSFDGDDEDTIENQVSNQLKGLINGPERTKESKSGLAIRFTSPTDRIRIEGELPDMHQMTFSVWLNNSDNIENAGIFSDYDDGYGNDLFLAMIGSSGVHLRADKDGDDLKGEIRFDRPWKTGWNHLVWVMGKRESRIFLNGELAGFLLQRGSNSGNHGASLGYAHDGSDFRGFSGIMDEVCIWRRSLSEEEVVSLFKSQL